MLNMFSCIYWSFILLPLKTVCLELGSSGSHCNPSFSGGRNQGDHSLKPAQANSSQDRISKKLSQKRAGVVAQDVKKKKMCI
jgi:hypothetical protein